MISICSLTLVFNVQQNGLVISIKGGNIHSLNNMAKSIYNNVHLQQQQQKYDKFRQNPVKRLCGEMCRILL